jgi:tellurite resistance protein TehA-like permease
MDKRISERKVIIFTTSLVVISGLIKLLSYKIGIVLFYLAFSLFIIYRLNFYFKLRGKEKSQNDRYRFIVLIAMIATIILNILGIQDVEFFLLFLLMVDFLLVINKKF